MGEVVRLDIPVGDHMELEPDTILEANFGKFQSLVLLGYDADGNIAVCSSRGRHETLWALERAKHHLLIECSE